MKKTKAAAELMVMIFSFGLFLTSCNQNKRNQEPEDRERQVQTTPEDTLVRTYQARISSLNESANQDRQVSGTVSLEIQGNQLRVTIEASGLEPDMMHLQHLHGSKEGRDSSCPDSNADINNDGVIDITEAYEVAGVTMIPFHDSPTSMEVDTQTYPTADDNGNISYQQTIDLNELRNVFEENFDWEELDFSKFTYLIHGVQENAVPETAGSVKGLPAHVTLPVGCADFSEE